MFGNRVVRKQRGFFYQGLAIYLAFLISTIFTPMFQNTGFSIFSILGIAVAAFALAWVYYFWRKDQNTFSRPVRFGLFALRSTGLFFIGLLLLGLIFPKKSKRTEPANIFFLIDESSSMLNYSDSTNVKMLLPEIIEAAKNRLSEKFLTRFIYFSNEVELNDALAFDGASTNLATGFAHIRDLYINNNLGAVVLISDGNYNEGIHPRYEAEKIKFTPIYTLGVGDTLTKRDAKITNVVANNIAFSGNIFL